MSTTCLQITNKEGDDLRVDLKEPLEACVCPEDEIEICITNDELDVEIVNDTLDVKVVGDVEATGCLQIAQGLKNDVCDVFAGIVEKRIDGTPKTFVSQGEDGLNLSITGAGDCVFVVEKLNISVCIPTGSADFQIDSIIPITINYIKGGEIVRIFNGPFIKGPGNLSRLLTNDGDILYRLDIDLTNDYLCNILLNDGDQIDAELLGQVPSEWKQKIIVSGCYKKCIKEVDCHFRCEDEPVVV